MIIPQKYRLKSTIKYPTSLIIGGANRLGFEMAESLMEQGGYVVIIDAATEENLIELHNATNENSLISFLDFSALPQLEDEIRRLDYVFFFTHNNLALSNEISTQEFLMYSNYLDTALSLGKKFDAKFLLTTSIKKSQKAYLQFGLDRHAYRNPDDEFTTYSDIEMQKYAEGLTMEYHKKKGLNSRVVRLGEIIGDAFEFDPKSPLTRLLFQGIKGETLRLYNDGLEQEWYVHILDAAYGILKAMFSKNTNGEKYSISYDTVFSHLSIAYKIQEIEEEAREIQFVESETPVLPDINLYKPAPNLATIGWVPKISFDKAMKQTLAAAKIVSLQKDGKAITTKQNNLNSQQNSFLGKLRSFFFGTKPNAHKKGSLEASHESIKYKRKSFRNNKNVFNRFFWSFYIALGNTSNFFKRLSPLELGALIVLVPLLFLIYIFVVSPLLLSIRSGVIIYQEVEEIPQHAINMQYSELKRLSIDGVESIEIILDTYEQFEPIARRIFETNRINTVENDIETIRAGFESMLDVSTTLTNFENYLKLFNFEGQFINSNDNYIAVQNQPIDATEPLQELEQNVPFLTAGLNKYSQIDSSVVTIQPFQTTWNNIQIAMNNLRGKEYVQYLPEFLGIYSPKNYLFLLVDNSRLTPIGGDIAGFILLTVSNGSIVSARAQPIDFQEFRIDTLDSSVIEKINSTRFRQLDRSEITIKELSSIGDVAYFSEIISDIWDENFNRDIDSLFFVNLQTMQSLLEQLDNSLTNAGESSVAILGVDFTDGSILQNLNSLQTINPNVVERRRIITELGSKIYVEYLENLHVLISDLELVIKESLENSNIRAIGLSGTFHSLFESENYGGQEIYETDMYIKPAILNDSQSVINVERFTSIPITYQITIRENYAFVHNITFNYPNWGDIQDISLCVPDNILLSSVESETIPESRIRLNRVDGEVCIVANSISETQFNVEFETLPIISQIDETERINIGIGKIPGALTSDLTVRIENQSDTLATLLEPESVEFRGNTTTFSTILNHDKFIVIELTP